jgi:hypothetical protein
MTTVFQFSCKAEAPLTSNWMAPTSYLSGARSISLISASCRAAPSTGTLVSPYPYMSRALSHFLSRLRSRAAPRTSNTLSTHSAHVRGALITNPAASAAGSAPDQSDSVIQVKDVRGAPINQLDGNVERALDQIRIITHHAHVEGDLYHTNQNPNDLNGNKYQITSNTRA